jgi:hypothetical protein
MSRWQRGQLVELDGLLGVVVGVEGDPDVPEDHIAVWFGDPRCRRKSEGGLGGERPEVWTIPQEYFVSASAPIYKH